MGLALPLALLLAALGAVSGHGRLVEPPSRSSMWRFGFKTKPNYNDNELFCGGYTVHWQRNGGKCGVCGDAWHLPTPRPNEAGGTYGRGIIVRRYSPGQIIMSTVDITANHKGFFEFKLCPHNSPSTIVSQDCLDKIPLQMADGSGTRYYPSFGTGPFNVQLKLPEDVTCSQCVFQWTYTAGNNWGSCGNGTSKVGCGPQETFRGCADIAIDDSESNDIPLYQGQLPGSISSIPSRKPTVRSRPRTRPTLASRRRPSTRPTRKPYYNRRPTPVTTRRPSVVRWSTRWTPSTTRWTPAPRKTITRRPTYKRPQTRGPSRKRPTSTSRRTTSRPRYNNNNNYSKPKQNVTKKPRPTYKPKPAAKKPAIESEDKDWSCKAVGVWKSVSGIASWCESNCPRGYCPSTHCDCSRRKK